MQIVVITAMIVTLNNQVFRVEARSNVDVADPAACEQIAAEWAEQLVSNQIQALTEDGNTVTISYTFTDSCPE